MADSTKEQKPSEINVKEDLTPFSVIGSTGDFKPNPFDCIPVSIQERMAQSNEINRKWLEARERDMKRE
jgi:hypothetical protein